MWNVESFHDETCCLEKYLVSSDLPLNVKFSESPLGYKPKWLSNKNKGNENGLIQPCQIITLQLKMNLYKCAELAEHPKEETNL